MSLAVLISTVWCLLVFTTCTFVVPAMQFSSSNSLLDRMSRGGLLAGALWVFSAPVLGALKCYNAITLIALAMGILLVRNIRGAVSMRSAVIAWPDQVLLWLARSRSWMDQSPNTAIRRLLRHRWIHKRACSLAAIPKLTFFMLVLLGGVIALSFSAHLLHWSNVRLVHSDEYLSLIRTRQLILNVEAMKRPLLFPALSSATSLLSSADPLYVIRALAAAIPFLITLAIGRVTFLLTHSLLAASAAMYCQNLPLLQLFLLPVMSAIFGADAGIVEVLRGPLPDSLELETSLLFLLLWVTVLLKAKAAAKQEIDATTVACALILTSSSMLLLLTAPFAGLCCLARKPRLLFVLGIVAFTAGTLIWQIRHPEISGDALQCLPCLLSIVVGLAVYTVEVVFVALAGSAGRPVVALAALCLALYRYPPSIENGQLLEYDSAAKEANLIAHGFTPLRWSIAAPVEQFAEVYSQGDFQDLATFVDASAAGDVSKAMASNASVDDLFIFVEKTPFTPFVKEPESVTFSTLTDSTYRNYRSPAGRASLELRAMQLCETYKKSHTAMTIYFEDDNIRIYHLGRNREVARGP